MISDTQLAEFPPFPNTLTEVYLGRNPRLSSIRFPPNVRLFCCCDAPITALPELPTSLNVINLTNCLLTELPDLPNSIQILNTVGNPLLLLRTEDESIPAYNRRWQQLRAERASQLRCVYRCSAVKEDLMAMAWRPERVAKMIACGDYGMLDY